MYYISTLFTVRYNIDNNISSENISITLTTTITAAELMVTLIIKDSSDDKHDFGDKDDNGNSR